IDTGGTFTDFVVAKGSRITSFKAPSTPHNPARAILDGLARIIRETASHPSEIVHGTTVGTNALLQRRGARTALVTTEGFEDVIEIGRQARPELYNLNAIKPAPLVSSALRFGIRERVVASGEILEPMDQRELARLIRKLKKSGCESIAVSLLFSFANPKHEARIAEALA